MVVIFNIIESIKIIDKEIDGLVKKSDKEIDELYSQEIQKADPKVNLLYHIYYQNEIYIFHFNIVIYCN